MIRSIRFILLLAALASGPAAAQAKDASPLSARTIVERAFAAAGGDAWRYPGDDLASWSLS